MINLPIDQSTGAFAIHDGKILVESQGYICAFDMAGKLLSREASGVPEGMTLTGLRVRASGVLEKTIQRYYEFPEGEPDEATLIVGKGKPTWFNESLPTSWQNQGTVWTPDGICAFGPGYLPRAPERRAAWGPSLVHRNRSYTALGFHQCRYKRPEGAEGDRRDWVVPYQNRWTALDTITGCVYYRKQLWFVVHLGMGYCRYEPGGLVADRMEHWLLRLDWGSWKPTWERLDFEARNISLWQGVPHFLVAEWDQGNLRYGVRTAEK